jgi:rsbT co-antagonist protein RsbR
MHSADPRDAEISALQTRIALLESQAQASEGRFFALLESLDVGIIVQGKQTEILLHNPRALELLGLTLEQIQGISSFDPRWNICDINDQPFPAERRPVAQALKTRQPVRNVAIGVATGASGERTWLLVNAVPQLNASGELVQVVATFTDITAYRHATQALQEKERHLNELSTPLVPLSPNVVLLPLMGSVDAARTRQMLNVLVEGVAHLRANTVVLDITGVTQVDPHLPLGIVRAAQAVRLLGAQMWLTGVRPQVASALVQLGADLGTIITRSTLQSALRELLAVRPEPNTAPA